MSWPSSFMPLEPQGAQSGFCGGTHHPCGHRSSSWALAVTHMGAGQHFYEHFLVLMDAGCCVILMGAICHSHGLFVSLMGAGGHLPVIMTVLVVISVAGWWNSSVGRLHLWQHGGPRPVQCKVSEWWPFRSSNSSLGCILVQTGYNRFKTSFSTTYAIIFAILQNECKNVQKTGLNRPDRSTLTGLFAVF
ncbi:uncharacterized protein LACBIDRAFT_326620 [Laccaria bicolor S238N-H82]|uniref:Predicted protein n=1 Tax=Laccaria bicolor (strain S238N-H82 / ATCC MYA-4686) TaxID=486041 RepID=B0D992_LACBS|nr:uncharacterized protein LACBIDRAFT_326620 [Laccaria bicolor S238N-H82]EDR08974.1 predicted protein [Laccaria bicolor S238N-H82]|eukprot:XP_001880287.1 predicted protein [Laccaria bicolor S238N-H82]